MKKLLILLLLFSAFASKAQVYQNDGAFGRSIDRYEVRKALHIPTFCGVPNLTGDVLLNKSALAYDSCGHQFYVYDPSDSTWNTISAAAVASANADSLKKLPVDTTNNNQDYFLSFDSTNHKWVLRSSGSGISSGDTTVFAVALDSTGQPQARILFSNGDNHITSNSKLLVDSANKKIGINVNNISQGGSGTKLVVGGNGNALITGNTTSSSFITIGGASSDFVKGDGSLDPSTYRKTTDSLNTSFLTGPKIDSALLPKQNFLFTYPLYAVNDTTAGIRTDSLPLMTLGAGADTSFISGRKLTTADWVLARVGSGGGGSSSTIDTTVTATSNGQTNFVFASLPSRYIVFVNNMPFTNFTTSVGNTIIVGFTDIVAGDIIRLYQTQ